MTHQLPTARSDASAPSPLVALQVRRLPWLLMTATVVTACELEEIVVDEGDPVTVVSAVMRPDRPQQWVLVETSLTGAPEGSSETGQVPGGVGRPMTGARVSVANVTFPSDPCGAEVVFSAQPEDPDDATDGVYWSPAGCPTMRPGDTLELRVETPGGSLVTGSTEIPGIGGVTLRAAGREQTMPGPMFGFNRDTDTLIAQVQAVGGRALQIEIAQRNRGGASWFFVDSTAVTLPGTIPDLFDRDFDLDDDVPDLFLAGVYYEFTAAWTDRNYFDFARSVNSPLSGRGFINSLQGGMGVFGSMVAVTTELKVTGNVDQPIEGLYQLTGDVAGTSVDITWELYLGSSGFANLAGFVNGQWVFGPLDDFLTGGTHGSAEFSAMIAQSRSPSSDPTALEPFFLNGRLRSDGPFNVAVFFDGDTYTIEGRRVSP